MESIPGGAYKDQFQRWHDAEGRPLSAEQIRMAEELVAKNAAANAEPVSAPAGFESLVAAIRGNQSNAPKNAPKVKVRGEQTVAPDIIPGPNETPADEPPTDEGDDDEGEGDEGVTGEGLEVGEVGAEPKKKPGRPRKAQ